MEKKKDKIRVGEKEQRIGCKDSVQCIPESDRGAHHIVRSVHTQRPSVFIPNGHQLQFSSDAHSGISIHPVLLVHLIAPQTNKQTKSISSTEEKSRCPKMIPSDRCLPRFPEHSINASNVPLLRGQFPRFITSSALLTRQSLEGSNGDSAEA